VTYTAGAFDYKHPERTRYYIADIAHSLALTNRFKGHTRIPYSVAEHCMRVSKECPFDPLAALLHDAAEAYIGDIASPQKTGLGWRGPKKSFIRFVDLEKRILSEIGRQFGILNLEKRVESDEIKIADRRMCDTEARDLMPAHRELQGVTTSPYPFEIVPWDHRECEALFLAIFNELMTREGKG